MRRVVVPLVLAALLAAPATAAGQSNPFSPLPQAPPRATPTPPPADPSGDGEIGRVTLALIGLGVLLSFFAIGWAITRDARRALTERDRNALEREEGVRGGDRSPAGRAAAKRRARQRAKAQRAARKRNR